MSFNLLKGKKGIIFGALNEQSIAWKVAERAVEEGAEIVDSILMPGTVVRKGARVQYAILAENTEIGANARVGESPEECADLTHWGVAVVASGIRVGTGAVVQAKAMVESDIPENGEVSIHA